MSEDAGRRTKPVGIAEFLFNELRQAFQDVRQKVVEEGWFGRVVTAAPVVELGKETPEAHDSRREHRPTFEELWGTRPAPTETEHQQEVDLDR